MFMFFSAVCVFMCMNNNFFCTKKFYQPVCSKCYQHHAHHCFKIMKRFFRNTCFKNNHQQNGQEEIIIESVESLQPEAIRQTVKVKNNTISIILPENFNAEEVDVIILPAEKKEYSIPQWQIDEVRDRTEKYLKNPESATNIDDFLKEIENEL